MSCLICASVAGSASAVLIDWAGRLHFDQLLRCATEMRTEVMSGRGAIKEAQATVREAKEAAAAAQRALAEAQKRADDSAKHAEERHAREIADLKAAREAEAKELKAAKSLVRWHLWPPAATMAWLSLVSPGNPGLSHVQEERQKGTETEERQGLGRDR